jgi:hypothetical protein
MGPHGTFRSNSNAESICHSLAHLFTFLLSYINTNSLVLFKFNLQYIFFKKVFISWRDQIVMYSCTMGGERAGPMGRE